jgi:hypothetical protein
MAESSSIEIVLNIHIIFIKSYNNDKIVLVQDKIRSLFGIVLNKFAIKDMDVFYLNLR